MKFVCSLEICGMNLFNKVRINQLPVSVATWHHAGSAKANGREPKTGLGRVFNSKLGCIATPGSKCMVCLQPFLKLKTQPKVRPVS